MSTSSVHLTAAVVKPFVVVQPAKTLALYRPSDVEIDSILASAAKAWPVLADRTVKAAAILRNGLTVDEIGWSKLNVVRWTMTSQTKRDLTHSVVGHHRLTCSCQDRAPMIPDAYGHRRFCKHTIAVAAYGRILRDHLNAHIQAFDVRLSALHTGECEVYAPRLGSVFVKADERGVYGFVDEASAVRYSLWLARRQAAHALATAQVAA